MLSRNSTHKVSTFKNDLKNIFPNYEDFYIIIDYENSRNVVVQDKFGFLKSTASRLKERKIPCISTAINKVEYIRNIIFDNFSNYTDYYEIVGTTFDECYKGRKETKIIVRTKYGECSSSLGHLKLKKLPSIKTAIDKNEYFSNMLKENNSFYAQGLFEVKTNFTRTEDYVVISTKYGECKVKANNLLQGDFATILSALNKTDYFLQNLKDTQQKVFETYDFSEFEYTKNNKSSKVYCQHHNEFYITPAVLLRGGGCEKCGYILTKEYIRSNPTGWSYTNWQNAGDRSKNFDSFKVYIIRCWNEEEEFYKIGKTFTTVSGRFFPCSIPYKYEIIKTFESKTEGKYISELEVKLQKQNKNHKYIPKEEFGGMYECFKQVNYEL